MMLRRKSLLLLALIGFAALSVGAYFYFWGDEDEAIINRNLARLVELAQKNGDESPFVTLGQSRDAMKFIAQEPQINVGRPLPLITDREELEGSLIQVRQSLQELSVRIIRKDLVVAEDGQTAQMELEAEGIANYSGERRRDRREFSIEWVKEDGDWLIRTVSLEGSPGGPSGGADFPKL